MQQTKPCKTLGLKSGHVALEMMLSSNGLGRQQQRASSILREGFICLAQITSKRSHKCSFVGNLGQKGQKQNQTIVDEGVLKQQIA